MKKILIVGASGQVGEALISVLIENNLNFDGTYSLNKLRNLIYFSLADDEQSLDYSAYSTVIICAGIAGMNVDRNLELAKKVNINGTINLIKNAKINGCKIIFLSSSAVFSLEQQGAKESDSPNPSLTYGKHKLIIEEYLQEIYEDNTLYSIIRPTKILSKNSGMIKNWIAGSDIKVNSSVTISPISSIFLAKFIAKILELNLFGIFHVSGNQEIDYFTFANEYISFSNLEISKDKLITYSDTSQIQNSASFLTTEYDFEYMNNIQNFTETLSDLAP